MAVTESVLRIDFRNTDNGFYSPAGQCSTYFNGIGWRGSTSCSGGLQDSAGIRIDSIPLAYNQILQSIRILAESTSGIKVIQSTVILGGNSGQRIDRNIGVNDATVDATYVMGTSVWGQTPSLDIGLSVNANQGGTMTIVALDLGVVTNDDITPPIGTGGPQEELSGNCGTNIQYIYGSGVPCVGDGDIFKITSEIADIGNAIAVIFSHPTSIIFTNEVGWDSSKVTANPYLLGEQPLNTTVYSFNITQLPTPSSNGGEMIVSKLEIFGPATGIPYEVFIKVKFIYTGDPSTPIDTSGQFGAITDGLDGIKQAIIDSSTNLHTDINDKVNSVSDGLVGLKADLSTKYNDFRDLLTKSIPQSIAALFTGNAPNSTNIIDALIRSIQALIAYGVTYISGEVNKVWTANKQFALNEIAKFDNPITTTIIRQGEVIDRLLAGNYTDEGEFYGALKGAGNNIQLLQFIQNSFALLFGTIYFLKAKIDVAAIQIKYLILGQYHPIVPDIPVLINAYRRGEIDKSIMYGYARKQGFYTDKVNQYLAASETILNQEQIKELYLKGIITELMHDNFLFKIGVSYDNAQWLRKNYQIMLGGADVTRIADKHIYSNDIPTIFGQYSEIDQGYIDAMAKIGVSPEQTRLLWAAHWSLPSFEQTFDMWHRGDINDAELNTFFALTDIMPFFREKLKNLSHNLIGRVDIRRFFSVGVYNQDEVFKAYKKLGYSDADAQKQTDFTVTHERLSEEPAKVKIRSLTETMVLKAYKRGIINETDAIARLGKVGYLPQDASLILRLETQIDSASLAADKTQHYHDKAINLIIDSVSKGVISDNDARGFLSALGVPNVEINSELVYADIERITRIKTLIINHIKTAYSQGMINNNQARSVMLSKGFTSGEVELLLDELTILVDLRNKPLTEKQIAELATDGIIDQQTTMTELHNIGYTDQHVLWLTQQIFKVQ